jgi:hypothetical protein
MRSLPSRRDGAETPGRRPQCRPGRRPGTGKTHLASAVGVQAIEHHRKRVRFFSTVELVNALEQEKLQGKPGQIAGRLTHSDLVSLDELGYLPFSASGGALLFHLLSKLYERTSYGLGGTTYAPALRFLGSIKHTLTMRKGARSPRRGQARIRGNDTLFTGMSFPALANYFPVPILREFARNKLKTRAISEPIFAKTARKLKIPCYLIPVFFCA